MNREEDKNRKEPLEEKAGGENVAGNGSQDNDQHSYPGKLDKVEGNMHNGEIGGGIQNPDDQKNTNHG